MSQELQTRFEQFVELLLRDRVEVVFFLSPYHPLVYGHLIRSDEYRIIAAVEEYFRSVAQERGIRLVGSYDPARLGLVEENFYDGFHPRREAVQRMFRRLSASTRGN